MSKLLFSSLKLSSRQFVNVRSKRTILFHTPSSNLQRNYGSDFRRDASKFSTNLRKAIVDETIASVKNSPPEPDPTEPVPHWVQSPIDYQIFKAENLDELLNLVEKYRFTGPQCVSFLVRLGKFIPMDVEKLQQDVRFQSICENLTREIEFLNPASILLSLRSLLFLKTSETSPSIPLQRLRNAVRHLIRIRMSPSSLVPFACFHVDYAENCPSGVLLQEEMENFIKLSLNEMNDAKLILMMLSKIRRDKEFTKRLELRAMDMIDSITSNQLTLLLQYVSNANSRNSQLLQAVGKKICDTNNVIPIKHLHLLLTAANHLSYFEMNFLKRICDDLEAQVKNIDKHYYVEQLCIQIGNARLRHEKILAGLIEINSKMFDFFKPSTFCSLIIMLARCNFMPSNDDQKAFLIKIRDYVSFEMIKKNVLWLDYVWALSILQMLTAKEAGSILDKQFYTNLYDDKDEYRNLITSLKLLNVNTAARLELKNYDGPLLDESIAKNLLSSENHTMSKYKRHALDVFSNAFTCVTSKCLARSRLSPEGYIIDFETRLDSNEIPLYVEKWDSQPQEQIKIAILIWNLFDKTKVTDHLWGLNAMAVRHLELSGYRVVQIYSNTMMKLNTPLARTEYLNGLFKKIIENKSDSIEKD